MLELRAVDVNYGAAPALRGISLSIADGELVSIVGPNGAGKTTLVNAIAGLLRVAAGSMTFGSHDLVRLPGHRVCATGIAVVPEGRRLFTTLTVGENLELGSYHVAGAQARRAALARVRTFFPLLMQWEGRRAGTLSGGQQQMVAIARALMARPRLLLLDEPSLGLAPTIVLDMFRVIRAINAEGTAILLVEQNVAMAFDVATRAYVIEEGRIVTAGTPEALVAEPHIRRAYLGSADDT